MESIREEIDNIKGRKIIRVIKTVTKIDYTIISEQESKWDLRDSEFNQIKINDLPELLNLSDLPIDIKKRKYLAESIGLTEIPIPMYEAFNNLNGLFDEYFKEEDKQINILEIIKLDENSL